MGGADLWFWSELKSEWPPSLRESEAGPPAEPADRICANEPDGGRNDDTTFLPTSHHPDMKKCGIDQPGEQMSGLLSGIWAERVLRIYFQIGMLEWRPRASV